MNLHIGTPSVNDENNSINSNHPSFHDDESVDNDGNDKYNSPRMVNKTYQRQSYTPRSNSSSLSRDIQKIEKRTPLNPKIIWSGDIAKFREFKSQLIGHCRQNGMGYLFDKVFQDEYLKKGYYCDYSPVGGMPLPPLQIYKDVQFLYGALEQAFRDKAGTKQLIEHADTFDGLKAWLDLDSAYDQEGSLELRITLKEQIISTPFHRNYPGGLYAWLNNYDAAFSELANKLGQTTWSEDKNKKRRVIQMLGKANFSWLRTTSKNQTYAHMMMDLKEQAVTQEAYNQMNAYTRARHVNTDDTQDVIDLSIFNTNTQTRKKSNLERVPPNLFNQLPQWVRDMVVQHRRKMMEQTNNQLNKENQSPVKTPYIKELNNNDLPKTI